MQLKRNLQVERKKENYMTITIECECGNRIAMNVSSKKYLQLRDNLEIHDFRFDGAEYDKNNKVSEFRI